MQRLHLGIPEIHPVQADLELDEGIPSRGGLETRHEAALRVLRGQHAAEELRIRHRAAGQLGYQGLLEAGQLRRRRFVVLQAEGESPGLLAVVGRGVPQDADPIALPDGRATVLRADGEELTALRVGQEVSELDRHVWLAAHAPFYSTNKKNAVRRTHLPPPAGRVPLRRLCSGRHLRRPVAPVLPRRAARPPSHAPAEPVARREHHINGDVYQPSADLPNADGHPVRSSRPRF